MLSKVFKYILAVTLLISFGAPAQSTNMLPSFSPVVEKATPAIVNISTKQKIEVKNPFDGMDLPEGFDLFKDLFDREFGVPEERTRKGSSLGSGFIIDPDGYIVTNHHVIADADEVTVTLAGEDGKDFKAKIIGKDPKTDLAILKIDPQEKLPFLKFGDSDQAKVGDWIVAIGNPFGLGGSVTAGIISAKSRFLPGMYDDFIQTDASINRGNSGGPMLNLEGEVIGVNSVIISPSGANVGIGLAIPSNLANPIITQLREKGTILRGWLGVIIQPVTEDIAKNLANHDTKGALVADIVKSGPAEKAGIKVGDIITRFDGKAINDMKMLPRMVAETEINKKVKVEVSRDNKILTLDVVIAKPEEDANDKKKSDKDGEDKGDKLLLGMKVENLTTSLRTKFKIEKDVSGVVITKLTRNSPGVEVGIKPGDVIMSFNKLKVANAADLSKLVSEAQKSGAKNAVLLIRRGNTNQFVVINLE